MECRATPSTSKYTRKRKTQPEKWKRNLAKKHRYSSQYVPLRPECGHNTKAYQCSTLTMDDLAKFHKAFFKYTDKETQDAYLLKFCTAVPTKRKRPKNSKHTEKKFQTKFTVYSKYEKKRIPVCQKAFLNILHITKHRVHYVMKKFFETGEPVKENRGGNHKSHLFSPKREAVIAFINLFHVDEAHYCRGKSRRYYLSAELSINKLFKQYNAQQTNDCLKVKRGFFRRIFNKNYSLGFGSPRTDVCSTCLQLLEKLKVEQDPIKQQSLRVEKRVHNLKAKAFFDMVKETRPDLKIFSFDCQKNMNLPKLPDQSTYYSRQLYLYNCTVVEGSSKDKLTEKNVFAFCWTENEFHKGSNEISSIVYHRLINTDLNGIKTVRLIADGCGGQNKNSIMLAMCCKWLAESAPTHVETLELVFPVVGHSFIPPDRVFAQIEKEVRKRETIVTPEEYLNLIKQWSTVIRLGTECAVYDFKNAMAPVMKPVGSWHFQFKKCKRFYIRRSKQSGNVIIKGDINYRISDGVFKKVTRKNKMPKDIIPNVIATTSQIKMNSLKLNDVKKLLTAHYGGQWQDIETLSFYKSVIDQESEIEDSSNIEQLCEPQEDDHSLRV